jgi:putative ABC transport system permease protein
VFKTPMWRRYARFFGVNPASDVRDELGFHIDAKVDDLIAQGWRAEDARREAVRQFGDLEGVRAMGEQLGRERELQRLRRDFWGGLKQDVRFGLRMLWKQPSFTLIAVLTLAFGIGATAAVSTLIQGVLLNPPPYKSPEQLMLITSVRSDGREVSGYRAWPALQWQDWQKQASSFEGIAGYAWTFNFLVRPDGSESLEGMMVSPGYFKVTGLEPVLGRTFSDSEGAPNSQPVIILGYSLWQRSFKGAPNVIGSTVRISRRDAPMTVVGVMPPGVRFLPSPGVVQEPNYNVNSEVDFWMPIIPSGQNRTQPRWDVVGRLRPGTTVARAQDELAVLARQEAEIERDFQGFAPRLTPLPAEMNRDGERILFPLLGAAVLVFLIACGNAAALMLVRGLQRQQEYAVRSALGVGRAALFQQASTESLLLALLGGSLGAALAFGLIRLFKLVGGHAIPRLDAVTTGWPVFLWGFAAALVAALVAGLMPAIRASRFDPIAVLKSAGPNSSSSPVERRLLRGVTVVQTALTLALLVGAGLLIRTMSNIANVPSGYNTSRILTMSVTAVQGDWAEFHHLALERVSTLPGVENAAFAWGVPLTGNNWQQLLEIEGQPEPTKMSERTLIPLRAVTPGYFALLRQHLVDGRDFRDTDKGDAPRVVIVNQALASRYFPNANPIGRKIWTRGRQNPPAEVIAVVADSRTNDLTREAEPEVYAPLWQMSAFSKHLVIRASADPLAIASAIQGQLRSVDPTVAVENVKTLDQIRGDSLSSRTFAMELLVGFAFIGSALTLVGIYGVLSLSVASRRRELAIRSALGAEGGVIRGLVFREGFRLITGGIVLGIVVALILARVLRTFLFGVEPTDITTLAGVGVAFAAVAVLACWVPMRRAVRVDPIEALRYE